jgi:transcriptional regulator with XRE-family HTH domain
MDLGHRVRDLRNARRLSQVELAARAGVARNTLNRIENGHLMPTAPIIEHLAEALNVAPGALFEEPVPLDEAPQGTGPTEAERRRPSLDEVWDVFAPFADGLSHYCARWEEKLPNLQGTREEVADFALDLQDFRAIILRVYEDELYAIAEALDLGRRYGDESGLPRDVRLGFIRAEAEEHSLMHEAIKGYNTVARALAESIDDEEMAESMRQGLAEVGV